MRALNKRAAKRFLCKALKASCGQSPRVINVDKNERLPPSIEQLKAEAILAQTCELRQNRYLNNLVELRTHRFIKKLVNPGLGFKSFYTARKTIIGYETMNSIRLGQIQGIEKGDIRRTSRVRVSNFRSCCIIHFNRAGFLVLIKFLQQNR